MKYGHVRDGFPRLLLTLQGHIGPINIEFILDTGFDGELSLPANILTQMQATFIKDETIMLADGSLSRRPVYRIEIEWDGQSRLTQVILLDNAPLMGIQLMDGKFLQAEMTDGGEVSLDDL